MGKKKKQEKQKKQEKLKHQKDKLKKLEKAGQKSEKETKKKAKEKTETDGNSKALTSTAKGRKRGSAGGDEMHKMAECFRALGDENRLRILVLLEEKELCAGDILKSMDIVQSTLSHHMKILTEAGLVICRKQGKWSYYSLEQKTREKLFSDRGTGFLK